MGLKQKIGKWLYNRDFEKLPIEIKANCRNCPNLLIGYEEWNGKKTLMASCETYDHYWVKDMGIEGSFWDYEYAFACKENPENRTPIEIDARQLKRPGAGDIVDGDYF